jgi:hypothetical protein
MGNAAMQLLVGLSLISGDRRRRPVAAVDGDHRQAADPLCPAFRLFDTANKSI